MSENKKKEKKTKQPKNSLDCNVNLQPYFSKQSKTKALLTYVIAQSLGAGSFWISIITGVTNTMQIAAVKIKCEFLEELSSIENKTITLLST